VPRHTFACMSDVDYTLDARLYIYDLIYSFFCHGRRVLTNFVYHISPTMPLYISWKHLFM
jgi:hypothetical protein